MMSAKEYIEEAIVELRRNQDTFRQEQTGHEIAANEAEEKVNNLQTQIENLEDVIAALLEKC